MKKIILLYLVLVLFSKCNAISFNGKTPQPSHGIWNALLKKFVTDDGHVNYKGFIKDSLELNKYLKILTDNPPNEKEWTSNQQKAYWINAYNAFTVKLIVKYYPVKSIKDIGSTIQIPFINTPWDIKFISIGDKILNLNNIEHSILRKKFKDPRLHFALVCAARSCPKLRNEAYTALKLEDQLTDQAKDFLADKSKNIIAADEVKISKIFSWYSMDFPKEENFIAFLNQYIPSKIKESAKITYMDYLWNLNE